MADEFTPVNSEGQVSASQLAALARRAQAAGNLDASGLDFTLDDGGATLVGPEPLRVTAKITGVSSGAYAWSQVGNVASGGTTAVEGLSGTTSIFPAYERNGSTAVPINTIVEMEIVPGLEEARFTHAVSSATSTVCFGPMVVCNMDGTGTNYYARLTLTNGVLSATFTTTPC